MSALPHASVPPATLRRGWCPSTLKPMETGDGWLVRLHPPGAVLTPAQLIRIAALAREHGNGLIEISARGNMQLRGVTAQSHPALVAALLGEHLVDEHGGDGPQRLTLISPLAGDGEMIDAAALAEAIEARGRLVPGLPAKFSIIVDGGGALALDSLACDLRLLAIATDRIIIGLPDASWRGPIAVADVVKAVETMLRRFAGHHAQAPEAVRRLRDLPPEALAALCGLPETVAPPPRPAPHRAGRFALGSGSFAAIAALPFGRCDAATLEALGHAARAQGTRALRLSPWRGLACLGLSEASAQAWLGEADGLGLITRDEDPRLSVQACAGKPACLRAETEAMSDGARLAEAAAPLLARGVSLHVSGCAKSCAHPGASDLTLVGRGGHYDVVLNGTTRDQPVATLDLCGILRRLQPGQDLFARLSAAASGYESLSTRYDYIQDGAAIYKRSFAIIRAEADLSRFSGSAARVVVRMIHACGMTDLPDDVEMSEDFTNAAEAALRAGAPILCDAKMVANGVTRARLPARNEVVCTLDDARTPGLAVELGTTRSAAAMELWRPQLAGALVVIGNAPTSLFRLLEMLDAGAPRPAAVIGIPVGFVGAAESKQALAGDGRVPFLVVHGRRGGSAMAAAAVNALAQEKE
ncbi:precorrin-8X methylmutase [Bosea psychrotolerans]|uniref:Precorrin-8X methylmutase n=1 Tax=Bosea psychrotolerans TaxID=1871628 RepID=A0A2S4MEN0_9HYPH|nr:precorrin-8X methylmutase [Bosea psychrotolerans]